METPNTDMLRGRVDIFVLKALSENDGYGYDILNYIHTRTEGHYEMKQSSIYSVLKRLEKQGYVYSYEGNESNGAKRRYYSLTENGKKMLADEETEWAYTRTLLDNLVSSKDFDLKNDTPPFRPSDLRPMTKRAPRAEDGEAEAEPETAPTVAETPVEPVSNTIITEQQPVSEEKEEVAATIVTEQPIRIFVEEPRPQPAPSVKEPEPEMVLPKTDFSSKDNYKDFFDQLFAEQNKTKPVSNTSTMPEINEIDCSHINDLRGRLGDEGIKLKSYEPTKAHKGLMHFVLVNKLVRDSVILSYLFLVAMLLIVYLCKPFGVGLNAVLIVGGLALILPVAALLICINNPEKKRKDNINIKVILSISFIIYVAFFIIDIIISLIIPNGLSLNSPGTYAPCIICLVVPFFGLLFALLYKTNNYHLISK